MHKLFIIVEYTTKFSHLHVNSESFAVESLNIFVAITEEIVCGFH